MQTDKRMLRATIIKYKILTSLRLRIKDFDVRRGCICTSIRKKIITSNVSDISLKKQILPWANFKWFCHWNNNRSKNCISCLNKASSIFLKNHQSFWSYREVYLRSSLKVRTIGWSIETSDLRESHRTK